MAEDGWLSSREGAELLGIPQSNYLYYAKNGDITFRQGKKGREYSRADTLKVKRRLATKSKRTPPEPPLIDWLYAADVPAGLKLDMQVYPGEINLASAAIYQSWRMHNQHLTLAAFSQDRQDCYAAIQLVPTFEQVAIDVLSGHRTESSILPDEIRSYEEPGAYILLANGAAVVKERPMLLYEVLTKYLQYWIEMYPDRYVTKIYAQTVSPAGVMLAQHLFMSPMHTLGRNAFVLDLAYPQAARILQRFKSALAEKAPLPDALQWSPPGELQATTE